MKRPSLLTVAFVLAITGSCASRWARAQANPSTRVTDPAMHARTGPRSYPYREQKERILAELDLRSGDVVVDIGAGDGWWTALLAERVGDCGVVHAAEVDQKKVDRMLERFAETPRVKPYRCEPTSPTLPENSCDLAFLSQTYHHLEQDTRVDYLRELAKVLRPTGRLVVIEKYPAIATVNENHGTSASALLAEAERAGWIPVRFELMVGTYHYLAIFAQKALFPPERQGDRRRRRRLRV